MQQIKKWTALAAAAALVLLTACGAVTLEHRGENSIAPAREAESNTLRVMTYNVKDCEDGTKIEEVANEIKTQHPDIVCLQELDWATQRAGGKEVLKLLAQAAGMNYRFYPTIKLQGGEYGIGIMSVYPLEDCEMFRLDTGKEEGRVLAKAQVKVKDTTVTVYNTHLSFEDKEMRLKQFDFLQETISANAPFVLMGDFNVESFDEYTHLKNVRLVNSQDSRYETYLGEDVQMRSLDNIIVSDNVTLQNHSMVKTGVSDHNMLVAELKLP